MALVDLKTIEASVAPSPSRASSLTSRTSWAHGDSLFLLRGKGEGLVGEQAKRASHKFIFGVVLSTHSVTILKPAVAVGSSCSRNTKSLIR